MSAGVTVSFNSRQHGTLVFTCSLGPTPVCWKEVLVRRYDNCTSVCQVRVLLYLNRKGERSNQVHVTCTSGRKEKEKDTDVQRCRSEEVKRRGHEVKTRRHQSIM